LKIGSLNLTVVLVTVIFYTGCAGSNRLSDPWFGADKIYHFCGGGVVGGGVTAIAEHNGWSEGEARGLAFGVTLSLGAAKETYDLTVKKTGWSWKDLIWTAAGTLAGNLIATSLD
jgi:putative lipoprotein